MDRYTIVGENASGVKMRSVYVHAGVIHRDSSQGDCWQFITVPEEDHGVPHETSYHQQCDVPETVWIRKVVDVEETEE